MWMRKILEYLGLEFPDDFSWHTKNLGVSVLSSVIMLAATFTPVVSFHQLLIRNFPTDLSSSRFFILLVEVAGITLNLFGAKRLAWVLYGFTVFEIFSLFTSTLTLIGEINRTLADEATFGYDPSVSLGWGWLVILLGPVMMGRVYFNDFIAHWRKSA